MLNKSRLKIMLRKKSLGHINSELFGASEEELVAELNASEAALIEGGGGKEARIEFDAIYLFPTPTSNGEVESLCLFVNGEKIWNAPLKTFLPIVNSDGTPITYNYSNEAVVELYANCDSSGKGQKIGGFAVPAAPVYSATKHLPSLSNPHYNLGFTIFTKKI